MNITSSRDTNNKSQEQGMRISYQWLREYLNTKIRAESLGSLLTMAGHEVTAIEQRDRDSIFEMEITPNRADCLCHIGIAREASAIIKKKLRLPKIILPPKKATKPIKVNIEDKVDCPRYFARIVTDVKVHSSPKWLIRKIESIGLRPVNNIVDITNFVLLETGQPLHAFDLDKLTRQTIIVRRARQGEKMVTIDGLERELQPDMLVIADELRPVAIAGVMGGRDTEVTEKTQNILLESAYFNPAVVRKTAFSLGLSTDSSYRFERGVDLAGVVWASDRAASLICGIAKGKLGNIEDCGIRKKRPNKITLRPARLNKILGSKLTPQKIKEILQRLGFGCEGTLVLEVVVPTYRDDVTREADLIEEVARIYGYENIPSQAPAIITTDEEPQAEEMMKKTDITKQTLASLGFNEVVTYSLISKQMANRMGIPEEGTIEIRNPLSREQEIMRKSLLTGIIKAVSYNIGRQIQDINIFELSSIYFIKEATYNEEPFLTIAQYRKGDGKRGEDYLSSAIFQLKGVIVALAERLGIARLGFEKTTHPLFAPDEALVVLSGDIMLGTMGRIESEVLESFDIKGHLYAAELDFKTVAESSSPSRFYCPLPRFPYSYRDISFAVDNNISYKEIAGLIKNKGGILVEGIELLSEYRGEQISEGQRGLAIRIIYRSKDRTLTEDEVNTVDKAIRENLAKTFKATLR